MTTPDSDFPYEVRQSKRWQRPVARFVYARDAMEYVQSDQARHYFNAPKGHPRADEQGRLATYDVDEYTVVDLRHNERAVVGLTGHGHAILDRIRATT